MEKNDFLYFNLKNTYETISPYSSSLTQSSLFFEKKFQIRIATKEYIDHVFSLAKNKFDTWKNTDKNIVVDKIKKFKNFLILNQTEIINTCHLEVGKSLKASETEFLRSIEYIDNSLNVFLNFSDNCFNLDERMGIFTRQPLGIVLAISPFNYPINLLISKVIPALLMKNCLVIKPASSGSETARLIYECLIKAGFEDGVVNFVTGRGEEISDLLVSNKNINLINFTGSTSVGKNISKKALFSQLIMELGGNDPAIVLEDADLEIAAKEIISGAFSFNGQRCTAIKRVYVKNEIFNKFKEILLTEFYKLTFSKSPKNNCVVTPLISKSAALNAFNIFKSSLEQMKKNDFEFFSLGLEKNNDNILNNNSNFIHPTIIFIDNDNYETLIEKEEQFAPILPIIKCNSLEKMIYLANKTEYGLQASLFTKNIDIINKCYLEINCGTLNVNQQTKRSPDIFPFQGIKNSGISQQGIYYSLINNSTIKGLVIKK